MINSFCKSPAYAALLYLCAALPFLAPLQANANVVISGTRVVYNAEEHEATIRLTNPSSTPSLVQVWLDDGDMKSTPDTGKSPFIATPPIFRIEPAKAQSVRIIYTGDPLPTDRESVFWMNVLDIPPMPATKNADDANYMQLAIRSRIKLFYRPKNLPGDPVAAADGVRWELVQKDDAVLLHAVNDAAFSVSMDHASLTVDGKDYQVATEMLLPMSGKDFMVRELKRLPAAAVKLDYATVNDFGAVISHASTVSPQHKP